MIEIIAPLFLMSQLRIITNREACIYEPDLLGEFVKDNGAVSLCVGNIYRHGYTRTDILNCILYYERDINCLPGTSCDIGDCPKVSPSF
jgi:hypothetical protein